MLKVGHFYGTPVDGIAPHDLAAAWNLTGTEAGSSLDHNLFINYSLCVGVNLFR